MIGVINASPLIYLGKIGALYLVPQLFAQVFTTPVVKLEVLRVEHAPERPVLEEAFEAWLELAAPQDTTLLNRLLRLQLHQGEAGILTLAKELKMEREDTIGIIDDLAAREVARTLGIPVTGTIGILLRGTKTELISKNECKRYLRKIIEDTDFHLSIKLYSKLVRELEELEP